MKAKRRFRILWQLILLGPLRQIIVSFIVLFCFLALLIMLFEPGISNYGDALWYCFVSCTTIGFGDFAAVSPLGRTVTVLLYLDAVVVIALITATAVQYFTEIVKAHHNESLAEFMHNMEHLPDLSPEELAEMSEKVRAFRAGKKAE